MSVSRTQRQIINKETDWHPCTFANPFLCYKTILEEFVNNTDYENCNKLISDMNKAVIKAIQITEEEDFAKKSHPNHEYLEL